MQERSICDGRWHLIYREKLTPSWRQVQADSKDWKLWGNRSYAETLRVKDRFPEPFRILAEMDPQTLGGQVPALELYDLKTDRTELNDLAAAQPDKVKELATKWEAWAKRVHVTPYPGGDAKKKDGADTAKAAAAD
jgi:N-sulfoglucosamine sulfohydrolase